MEFGERASALAQLFGCVRGVRALRVRAGRDRRRRRQQEG